MKLSTFIKSYKIALSEIYNKVKDWNRVYLGEFEFFEDSNIVTFTFSSTPDMEENSIGLKVSFNIHAISAISDGVEKIAVAKEYINKDSQINDIGRFLLVLENTYNQINSMDGEFDFKDLNFNLAKDVAVFNFIVTDDSKYRLSVYSDENMSMFGDYIKV